jgi:hypothetical protein
MKIFMTPPFVVLTNNRRDAPARHDRQLRSSQYGAAAAPGTPNRRRRRGLRYVDSWVEATFGRCFQLMECDDLGLLMTWISRWSDLVDFDVVPVVTSGEASAVAVAASHHP